MKYPLKPDPHATLDCQPASQQNALTTTGYNVLLWPQPVSPVAVLAPCWHHIMVMTGKRKRRKKEEEGREV